MNEDPKAVCPECQERVEPVAAVDRRNFIRVVSGGAAALLAGVPNVLAREGENVAKPGERAARPAEALIRELHASLTADQKQAVVHAWDHGAAKGTPTRLGMYNSPLAKKIGEVYTKPQQELIERILRSIGSGEKGYECLSRGGTFDGSGSLQGCGADIFGDLSDGNKFSWVFSGHHLTVRCDGNSEEGAAFGGPMYYGHSPNGYSGRNVFFFQTKRVLEVYDALSEKQRQQAVADGSPGEHAPSIRFRRRGEARPGVDYAQLSPDQRRLVEAVMRDLISPYRKEDGDEVMDIIKATGGLEKIHLAFYREGETSARQPWSFWRLEGPGFVWNYRVLPHVHCYVNISRKV